MRAFSNALQQSTLQKDSSGEGSKSTVSNLRADYDAALRQGARERTSTIALVQGAIVKTVAEMLFIDIDSIGPAKSVTDLGVDSLIAAELRSWFHQALATDISTLNLPDPNGPI
ncbi:hypothetical protein QQS21_000251 [Conoideocrella luteorostrata]|uniref:Carrier domain-containing protein n=1 Tax=Conoideocrella luteorostrata TaxID=1105319 RepID=A0AAJ0CZC1_9HYPO|nr:hypothetical protein QQS21_000251 [Conoideocrella luteorostrata]